MNTALSRSITERAVIMAKINEQVEGINKSFKKKPESIDLAVLKELLNNLEDTNAQMKQRKEELEAEWVSSQCGIWTGRTIVVIMVVSAVVAAGASFYLAIKSNNGNNATTNRVQKAMAGISGFAGLLSLISGVFFTLYTRQQDINDGAQDQAKFFKRFITMYEAQRKADMEKTEEIFHQYLQGLGALPQATIERFQLPPKPLWVEAAANSRQGERLKRQAEVIAAKSAEQKKPDHFGGEKAGHGSYLEPIAQPINIGAEFDRMETLLGFKLPYLSKDGCFYFRDGRIFDSVEKAEEATKSTEVLVSPVPD